MKKQLIVCAALPAFMIAAFVAEQIAKEKGHESQTVFVPNSDKYSRSEINALIEKYSTKEQEVIILGHISGHEWNRIAFSERRSLIDTILESQGLLNDPAFAHYRKSAEIFGSPAFSEVNSHLAMWNGLFDTDPKDHKNAASKMLAHYKEAFPLNQKTAVFVLNYMNKENLKVEMIPMKKDYLNCSVSVGLLSVSDVTKTGISLKDLISYSGQNSTKKPVDFLVVNDGKRVEIISQPWALSMVESVKETFAKKGFKVITENPKEIQKGLVTSLLSNTPVTPEAITAVFKSAMDEVQKVVFELQVA